jgi:hypothetical protein
VLHPCGHLLPHVAAFSEIDPVQRLEPGLQNIGLVRDQLDPGLWDGKGDADRFPVDGGGGSVFPPFDGESVRVGGGEVREPLGRLGEAARQTVLRFTWDKVCESLVKRLKEAHSDKDD